MAELDDVAKAAERSRDPMGGYVPVPSKRRIGQARFRQLLRDRFGDICAVSGRQPAEVLDAAHLYLFSHDAQHRLDGGLLLRSDIHRLFDSFRLTIDPDTWTIRVGPELREFECLRHFDGEHLKIPPALRPNPGWLKIHRDECFRRWSDS